MIQRNRDHHSFNSGKRYSQGRRHVYSGGGANAAPPGLLFVINAPPGWPEGGGGRFCPAPEPKNTQVFVILL